NVRQAANRNTCQTNQQQLGLAIHNYESTYSKLPAAYTLLTTADPDPNAQFAGRRVGLSLHANLLPFVEQDNLYKQLNPLVSEFNTVNIPPNGPHSGSNTAYAQPVKIYLSPPNPTPPPPPYSTPPPPPPGAAAASTACWGPYGAGGGAAGFPGGGTGSNLVPPPGQMWARSDYFPIAGIHDALIDSLGLRSQYPGSTQMAGTLNDPGLPGG